MTSKRKFYISLAVLVATTLLSALFLTACLALYFEPDEGYFKAGEGVPLRIAFAAVYILGLILCAVCGRLAPGGEELPRQNGVLAYKLRFVLSGTVLVLLGALEILLDLELSSEVSLMVGIGACLFGVYLLLVGAGKGFIASPAVLLCLYFSILLPIGITLGNSSNYYRHINSVENGLGAVVCISMMIYILYEGNRLVSGVHSRLHVVSMLAVLHSGLSIAVPYSLAYIGGSVNEASRFLQMVIILAFCAAVGAELARYLRLASSEQVHIEGDGLLIEGKVFSGSLYAREEMPDGTRRGTFRSYTVLVTGNDITFRDCVFENTAGRGEDVGQAIALFLDGDGIVLEDCTIRGHQDTLFLAPLPEVEMIPGGFTGPTEHLPRTPRTFHFKNCRIEGGVDFIFGGATAYFDGCELVSVEPGYVFAPSTPEDVEVGFVARNCRFTAAEDVPDGSCYIARPWRNFAAVRLENCELGPHIAPEGFSDWGKPDAHSTVRFEEIGSSIASPTVDRPDYVRFSG